MPIFIPQHQSSPSGERRVGTCPRDPPPSHGGSIWLHTSYDSNEYSLPPESDHSLMSTTFHTRLFLCGALLKRRPMWTSETLHKQTQNPTLTQEPTAVPPPRHRIPQRTFNWHAKTILCTCYCISKHQSTLLESKSREYSESGSGAVLIHTTYLKRTQNKTPKPTAHTLIHTNVSYCTD